MAKKNYRASVKQEEELSKKLFFLVFLIIFLVSFFTIAVIKYAPKIGGLFGLVSVHRNEDPNSAVAVPAPLFVNAPEATNDKTITLEGLAEPTTKIKLYVNGPEVTSVITDIEGKFTFPDVELIDGKNTIFAKAVGNGNMESPKSQTLEIRVDKDSPEIEIISPKPGDTVRNLNKRITVTGKVNEKAEVRVNERLAILKPDYSFEILLGVDEGSVEIKIEATDLAGNSSEETIKVTYQQKSN